MAERPKIKVQAHFQYDHGKDPSDHPEQPTSWEASARFDTPEAANAFASQFPKSAGVRATTLDTYEGGHRRLGLARAGATLKSNGVNGGVNETGIKRYRALNKAAQKLGVDVEFEGPPAPNYKGMYLNREQFHKAIGEPT